MSGGSSSGAGWCTRLEPVRPPEDIFRRADDPRLGEVVEFWQGQPDVALTGRAVLVDFPQDEGVTRNHGRFGAAAAPGEIRRWLYRLTPYDAAANIDLAVRPPLDLGNVQITGDLEETQQALGAVIGAILERGGIPVVLGGGHETAYGHYLGYVNARVLVGIINCDAHLDVRPCLDGRGHSGSPFRQALEHSTRPLPGPNYVCLGVLPHNVSREHLAYVRQRGCVLHWCDEVRGCLSTHFERQRDRLAAAGQSIYVSIDADVCQSADVPAVSAPNPLGLAGLEVARCAHLAGLSPSVTSLDLVEINPRFDADGESARWAALVVWNFLTGVAVRLHSPNVQ
jgi:formiminoglutamase